jgi:hypothetical protein
MSNHQIPNESSQNNLNSPANLIPNSTPTASHSSSLEKKKNKIMKKQNLQIIKV